VTQNTVTLFQSSSSSSGHDVRLANVPVFLYRDTTALNFENNIEHTKHGGTYTASKVYRLRRFST